HSMFSAVERRFARTAGRFSRLFCASITQTCETWFESSTLYRASVDRPDHFSVQSTVFSRTTAIEMYFPSYREIELLAYITRRRHRLYLLELARIVWMDMLVGPLHAATTSRPNEAPDAGTASICRSAHWRGAHR